LLGYTGNQTLIEEITIPEGVEETPPLCSFFETECTKSGMDANANLCGAFCSYTNPKKPIKKHKDRMKKKRERFIYVC
jgi:hypothetical protein